MTLEPANFSLLTKAEILSRYPRVGSIQQLMINSLHRLEQIGIQPLNSNDVEEVRLTLNKGIGPSRPSHAAVWLAILTEAVKDVPYLSFWRGDSHNYMMTAESGQFCLGDPKYSIDWSTVHHSNLVGRFSIVRLTTLYEQRIIWLRQEGYINSGIGWHIGTEKVGEKIAQHMEIFKLIG